MPVAWMWMAFCSFRRANTPLQETYGCETFPMLSMWTIVCEKRSPCLAHETTFAQNNQVNITYKIEYNTNSHRHNICTHTHILCQVYKHVCNSLRRTLKHYPHCTQYAHTTTTHIYSSSTQACVPNTFVSLYINFVKTFSQCDLLVWRIDQLWCELNYKIICSYYQNGAGFVNVKNIWSRYQYLQNPFIDISLSPAHARAVS